ncbi:hypothetical protein [Shewanella sp. SW24]|uniref:hypothetical protein n=1 Tax=Shewanella sp. SW24 TaxID=2912815 RepID=UPI0021D93B44|nr:hypothetical protein [Shewanella sp. SW24]MCU7988200.1 hypothetical protein [Shewanella sp. SW24]
MSQAAMSPQTLCRAVCHSFKGTGLRAEQGEGGSKSQAFARPRDLLRAALRAGGATLQRVGRFKGPDLPPV